MGDGCVVLLASDDDISLVPVAIHHQEPDGATFLRELFASAPVQISDDDFFGQVFRTGAPMLIPTLAPRQLPVKPAFDGYFDRFPVHSVLSVPLRVRGGRPVLRPALPQGVAPPAGDRVHPGPPRLALRPQDGRSLLDIAPYRSLATLA